MNNNIIPEFENYCHSLGVSDIAYTHLPPEYTTDDMYENTIVGIIQMDDELLGVEPDRSLKAKYKQLYVVITDLMTKICDFIEDNGYHTYMIDQLDRTINFSMVAQQANLGGIGNSNLLINDHIGPGHKILLITTDMPVEITTQESPVAKIVPKMCIKCFNCVKNCPNQALYIENNEVYYDKSKCIGYTDGCTYCIASCPFENRAMKNS
ncbi:MAG: 4Fe-4S dicluster domain-containing protein [Methanosphaera sp.]|nr:4Fe-4S dicluster domain-containing protein [Methanosphaera sp.]